MKSTSKGSVDTKSGKKTLKVNLAPTQGQMPRHMPQVAVVHGTSVFGILGK